MRTIFAKYNRERLPQFQTVTKLVELENGERCAIKEALLPEGAAHIAQIAKNYELLRARYPHISLVPPTTVDDTALLFPMADGISLEFLLKQALESNNQTKFYKLLDVFVAYVDSFVSEHNVVFAPCDKFKTVFGAWELDESQNLIEIANVDIIFSNLFLDTDGAITQIDYEWVFDCLLPKQFVIWRAINVFAHFVNLHSYKFISLDALFARYNILNFADPQWRSMDLSWQAYIRGANTLYMIKNSVQKRKIEPITRVNQFQQQLCNLGWTNNVELCDDLQRQLSEKNYELDAVYNSKSWKLTAPLRKIFKLLK